MKLWYKPYLMGIHHWPLCRTWLSWVKLSLNAVIDTLCEQLLRLEGNTYLLHSQTYFPHFRMTAEHADGYEGSPCGSGMVEWAVTVVINARMKKRDMRWKRDNTIAVVTLRVQQINARWQTPSAVVYSLIFGGTHVFLHLDSSPPLDTIRAWAKIGTDYLFKKKESMDEKTE